MSAAQTISAVRRPVAGDVIPRPPANPPFGELPGDEVLDMTQAERVEVEHGTGYRRAVELHDAEMGRLVDALHVGREVAA